MWWAGFVQFRSGVGVAEGLGDGLQKGWGLFLKPVYAGSSPVPGCKGLFVFRD